MASPPKIVILKDVNSVPTGGIDFDLPNSGWTQNALLAASTEASVIVPSTARSALFVYSPGTNVFVGQGNLMVTLPTTPTFTTANGELRPIIRNVIPGETIRLISDTPAYVTIRWFQSAMGHNL